MHAYQNGDRVGRDGAQEAERLLLTANPVLRGFWEAGATTRRKGSQPEAQGTFQKVRADKEIAGRDGDTRDKCLT